MSLRENLVTKIETQMAAWDKQIKSMEADSKNEQATASLKKQMNDSIHELRGKMEKAGNKLEEAKKTSEDKLKQIKGDVESWFH